VLVRREPLIHALEKSLRLFFQQLRKRGRGIGRHSVVDRGAFQAFTRLSRARQIVNVGRRDVCNHGPPEFNELFVHRMWNVVALHCLQPTIRANPDCTRAYQLLQQGGRPNIRATRLLDQGSEGLALAVHPQNCRLAVLIQELRGQMPGG